MPDSFTEFSSTSWFSRIGNSIMGMIFGALLVVGSIALIFFNETRAVTTAKSLTEGAKTVISVAADNVQPANDGKLIHLTGEAITTETLRDPMFGLDATALRLQRKVEMYQWKEDSHTTTEKKLGGGEEHRTEYTYTTAWADHPVQSSKFKHPEGHQNPNSLPVPKWSAVSTKATLGAFKLPQEIVEKMQGDETLPASDQALAKLPADLKSRAKLNDNGVYLGADPGAPAVGDARISFAVLKQPATFSILAQQTAGTLGPYTTHAGREIERVESGSLSAAVMFQHAQSENTVLTWILRGVGFVLMWIGFACALSPLKVLADVVPFVGGIVGFGTGLLAALLGFAGSLIVIAVAWLAARPILGGALLILAVAALIHGVRKVHANKPGGVST
jgi:hypothetical protein